jgi:hypothetical protein
MAAALGDHVAKKQGRYGPLEKSEGASGLRISKIKGGDFRRWLLLAWLPDPWNVTLIQQFILVREASDQ